MSVNFTYNTFKSSLCLGFCHTGFTIVWREPFHTNPERVNAANAAEIWNHDHKSQDQTNYEKNGPYSPENTVD